MSSSSLASPDVASSVRQRYATGATAPATTAGAQSAIRLRLGVTRPNWPGSRPPRCRAISDTPSAGLWDAQTGMLFEALDSGSCIRSPSFGVLRGSRVRWWWGQSSTRRLRRAMSRRSCRLVVAARWCSIRVLWCAAALALELGAVASLLSVRQPLPRGR